MCGITGLLEPAGADAVRLLRRVRPMTAALRHRLHYNSESKLEVNCANSLHPYSLRYWRGNHSRS